MGGMQRPGGGGEMKGMEMKGMPGKKDTSGGGKPR
jgi:hypothetical protein